MHFYSLIQTDYLTNKLFWHDKLTFFQESVKQKLSGWIILRTIIIREYVEKKIHAVALY